MGVQDFCTVLNIISFSDTACFTAVFKLDLFCQW